MMMMMMMMIPLLHSVSLQTVNYSSALFCFCFWQIFQGLFYFLLCWKYMLKKIELFFFFLERFVWLAEEKH